MRKFKASQIIELDRRRCEGYPLLPRLALAALSRVHMALTLSDEWTARATARDCEGGPIGCHEIPAVRWDFAGLIGRTRIRHPEDIGVQGKVHYPAYKLALQTAQTVAWRWCRMHCWWPATPVAAMVILNDNGGYNEVLKVLEESMRILASEAKLLDIDQEYASEGV